MAYKVNKYSPAVTGTVFLRLISAPVIFSSPWLAAIASFSLDWLDGEVFKRSGYTQKQYKLIDQWLDFYWYIFIVIFVNYHHTPGLIILNTLFSCRLLGHIAFVFTQKREVFMLFPNFFEIFFFFYLFSTVFPSLNRFLYWPKAVYPLLIFTPVVLYREWLVHIKKANMSDFFTGKKTYWNK